MSYAIYALLAAIYLRDQAQFIAWGEQQKRQSQPSNKEAGFGCLSVLMFVTATVVLAVNVLRDVL